MYALPVSLIIVPYRKVKTSNIPAQEMNFLFTLETKIPIKKEGKGASLVPMKRRLRDSLVIQWLRLQIPNAGGPRFCPRSGN